MNHGAGFGSVAMDPSPPLNHPAVPAAFDVDGEGPDNPDAMELVSHVTCMRSVLTCVGTCWDCWEEGGHYLLAQPVQWE